MSVIIVEKPTSIFEDFFPQELLDPWNYSPILTKLNNRRIQKRLRRQPKIVPIPNKDKDRFHVCMDVQQFSPDEISVKTNGRNITVEAKHEEKEDEHGTISRHFIRRFVLPEQYRPEDVISSLSPDGVLSVSAPKYEPLKNKNEREVPITITGPAHKTIQPQSKDKENNQTMDTN